jgi:uncharacterized protein
MMKHCVMEQQTAPMKFLNFLPKEALFYNLIHDLVMDAHKSSRALHDYVQSSEVGAAQPIAEARSHAKATLRTLIEEICRSFITPFDREDLQELAEGLYRISSSLDGIQERMHAHDLRPVDGDFQRISQIVIHQVDHLVSLIDGLNKNEKPSILQEKVAVIYDLEDQADNTALELERLLFSKSPVPDVRDLILRKELYQALEDVTDFNRDIAAIALRIILKHS